MQHVAIEQATAEFCTWKAHGRGTVLADLDIQPGPDFKPLFFHSGLMKHVVDDGHRPTVLSILAGMFKSKPRPPAAPTIQEFNLAFLAGTIL